MKLTTTKMRKSRIASWSAWYDQSVVLCRSSCVTSLRIQCFWDWLNFIFKENVFQQLVLHLQIKILQATGLPQYLSNFVFCQYTFWDQRDPIIVAPEVDMSSSSTSTKDPQCMVVFDSCKVRWSPEIWRVELNDTMRCYIKAWVTYHC